MKDFIITSGRGIFDFCAILIAIGIIILGGCFMQHGEMLLALAVWLGGYIAFIMSYYFAYTFIDINDNLKSLNKKMDTLLAYNKVLAEKIIEQKKAQ